VDYDEQRARDVEAITEGLPPGATVPVAYRTVIPARKWVKLAPDGTEIYLDADEDARFLVRKVAPQGPSRSRR
jgi:hypothetical protein